MKPFAAALVALSLAGPAAVAQSQKTVIPLAPAENAPSQPAPKAPAPSAPATKGQPAPVAPKKADDKKAKETPPPPIDGIVVSRGEQGFISVTVSNGTFVMRFYDERRRAKTPDVAQVALRWTPRNRSALERTLLTPGGANILTSSKVVLAPFNFKLYVTMLNEGGNATGESHVIDFQQ